MLLKFKQAVIQLCLALLCFIITSSAFGQSRTVTGKILGSDGTPVAGASITVNGTTTGTQTDASGNFSFAVPSGRNGLTISSVGFETQNVSISRGNTVAVTLKTSASNLNEIVVTGYSAQRKKDITGAVTVVNVSNMKQVPSGNAESLLQGQASGVTVTNSGVPGGGTSVRVRGVSSLGNSSPLYIVDGVQSFNGLRDIDPNDIESLQVLKDAGAAAIYGIQGSNGVVIVTTKRGHGQPTVSYNAYVGTQRPLSGNVFNLGNTQEYAQAIRTMENNSGVDPTKRTLQFGLGATPTIPVYITPEGANTADESTYNITSNPITKANQAGTDWFHEVFKPAMIQSHTLSVSSGSDKSSYFFSANYFNQEGTLINTYLKRYSMRANTLFTIKNHIRIGENANLIYRSSPTLTGGGNLNEGNAISMTYRIPPIIPVHDIAGNYAGTKSPHLSNAENPVAIQERTANNKTNDYQMNGNVFAEVDFLKHFTARTSFGGTFDNYYYYNFTYTPYERAEGNTNPNAFTEGAGYNSLWQWTNTLNYSNVFGKHNLKVLGGSEIKKLYLRGLSAGRINYFSTDPSYWTLNTGSPSGGVSNNGASPYQLALSSLFGRIDYSYNDRYLLSGTVRRDGGSVFSSDNRFGVFPSVTAGWRISEEEFFKGITFVNDLKIRGGWGKLGSISNIPATNQYTLYSSGAGYSYYPISGSYNTSSLGFYQSQLGNTATTWEQDIITNIGLDATLFNNKLNLSAEWYKKQVSGLLFRKVSLIGNYNGPALEPFVNFGNIENHGLDFNATYHAKIGRDFNLDITGNLTSYKSKVVSLPAGYKYVTQNSAGSTRIGAFTRTQPGQPVGEFFGYEVLGLFQDVADVTKSPTQDHAAPGRFKYRDVNGDGKINDDDRTWIGNPNPSFTYGLTVNANYKSFDFSVFFYGSQGNKDVNYVKYWTDFPGVFQGAVSKNAVYNSAQIVNASGQPTTVTDPAARVANPSATTPALEKDANFSNTTVFNSYYVENGSFLKCRSLMLGYTLPTSPLKKIGVDKLRIYVQGSNLFTVTKYTGLDPELQPSDFNNNSNFGIDFGNYPANQKSFLFGINASF